MAVAPGDAKIGNEMRIYLDHNATTPVRPEVVEAMSRQKIYAE